MLNLQLFKFMDERQSCTFSHLFHCGVIKENPLGRLGVEDEGTVVAAVEADHSHKQQFPLFGMLICHPVEELHQHTHKHRNKYTV